MELTKPWFSKATPKLLDYNPILHSPFYSHKASGSFATNASDLKQSRLQNNASNRSYESRGPFSLAKQPDNLLDTGDRLFKTRPKNTFADPITGAIHRFDRKAQPVESLGLRSNRDKCPRYLSPEIRALQSKPGQSVDRISGALRREVPSLTYVNPYQLKSITQNPIF